MTTDTLATIQYINHRLDLLPSQSAEIQAAVESMRRHVLGDEPTPPEPCGGAS
jgi:hypothetical protein